MNSTATRRFNKLCLSTLVAVYILILAGGVVRSTGSGMGCPDWPRCFGQWVPPTSVSQLPANYKEQYAEYREKKNEKFARYLSLLGFSDTAQRIKDDKSILVEADFNASKTIVEYINRVAGVVIGFMIIAVFISSWRIRKDYPRLFKGSSLLLILVIFQGWFGSIVVSTNLTSWTITVHMFLAIVMVAIIVWLMVRSRQESSLKISGLRPLVTIGLILVVIQIFLGTQVREMLDRLASLTSREEWISNAGMDFIIHRSFSYMVLGFPIVLWFRLRKTTAKKSLTLVPFVLILSSVFTGIAMAWFAVPPFLQPVHLLLAVVTFGWLFDVYLQANSSAEVIKN